MLLTRYHSGDQVEKNGKGGGMWHEWGAGEVHIGFWWEDLMEMDHLEDLGINGRIILKWIKWDEVVRNGFLWLRRGTRGGCF